MDNLIIIDLETTGTDPKFDEIIEIGAIKIKNSEIVDRFCSFVNPERKLTEEIIQITGINDDNLKDAPKIEDISSDLKEFVSDLPVLAHNMDFDSAFLLKNGIEADFLDTLDLSCLLFPLEKKHTQEYLLGNLFNVSYSGHRALEDVNNLFILYKHLVNRAKNMDERVKKEIRQTLKNSDWKFKALFKEPTDDVDNYLTPSREENRFCPKNLPKNADGIPMAHLMSWLFYTETGNITEISYWVRRKYEKFFKDVRVKKCSQNDCNYFNNNERLF